MPGSVCPLENEILDFLPQLRHLPGKLFRPRRSFATPEGNVGSRALGVFHQKSAGGALHAADAPGRAAQQHDVAAQALDRKVLIHGADHYSCGLRNHRIKRRLGNGSGIGDRRDPASAPSAHASAHLVAMQVSAVTPATRGDAVGKHGQYGLEIRARKITIRVGAANQIVKSLFIPILTSAGRYDLLGENIKRSFRDVNPIQLAAADGPHQSGALDQFIARLRKEAPLGDRPAPVPGPSDALKGHANRAGRADLADKVDGADVNSQFEGSRRHQHTRFTRLQFPLRFQSQLTRQASMVGSYRLLAQAFRQVVGHAFCQTAGVHEDQGGTMTAGKGGEPVIDLFPHFIRGNCSQFAVRNLNSQIERTAVAHVHDRGFWPAGAHQEASHQFNRLLGGRKSNADGRLAALRDHKLFQAFERQRQVRPAFVIGHGMNFIHNDGVNFAEKLAALLRCKQDVEGLGRGHQDVGRALQHGATLRRKRVTGADRGANAGQRQPAVRSQLRDFRERRLEILLNVVAQSFQWRDVNHRRRIPQFASHPLPHQAVNASQEGRKRFAGAGRRRDQRVPARQDVRPALFLRLGGKSETLQEPILHKSVRPRQTVGTVL